MTIDNLTGEREPHSLEFKTVLLPNGEEVWHYTCTPPTEKILKEYKIKCVGYQYNCEDNMGVLLIPKELYFRFFGIGPDKDQNVLIIQSESLLTKLNQIERAKTFKH